MKGTIISICLTILVVWSLNNRIFHVFFKVKRQRLYKNGSFYDTDIKMEKISNKANARKKRYKNRLTLK